MSGTLSLGFPAADLRETYSSHALKLTAQAQAELLKRTLQGFLLQVL